MQSLDATGFKKVTFAKIIIKGSFYSPPKTDVIEKYLKDNNLTSISHASKIGIDNYSKWVSLFKSDYLIFQYSNNANDANDANDANKMEYVIENLDDDKTDEKYDDFHKDNRVIIINDDVSMEQVHYYLNQMEMELYRYDFYEKINEDKTRELLIDVLYWWTM